MRLNDSSVGSIGNLNVIGNHSRQPQQQPNQALVHQDEAMQEHKFEVKTIVGGP